MIKNTCPNAGTPSAGAASAAETGAERAVAAAGMLRPATSASTGRSRTVILVRTETRLPRGQSRSGGQRPASPGQYLSLSGGGEPGPAGRTALTPGGKCWDAGRGID